MIRAGSLEFKGIVADYLFLKLMVLHGERLLDRKELSKTERQISYKALLQITELDPRFWDPYLFAETTFPWEGEMVAETNELLERAVLALPNDYRPNYFIWFNYYYFIKDPKKAAPYMEKASRMQGAPEYFKNLAARMRVYSGELQAGIVFLQQVIRETSSASERELLEKRLFSLQALELLESAVREFKKKNSRLPADINELITGGILKKIPPDPYGGEFFLMESGRVYTTSALAHAKKKTEDNVPAND
ncbi:MAG: hypothetical protein C4563_08345 [Desulfobulbus sp.]|nr:MAG: hypothetical protein C4563_08345 [Desulfobulbus sp.]